MNMPAPSTTSTPPATDPPAAAPAAAPPATDPPATDPPATDPPAPAAGTGLLDVKTTPAPAPAGVDLEGMPEWKKTLDPEFRDADCMKTINDPAALAKSFVHAQKLIGADKIALPGKHASDEDWNEIYGKLGRPEKAEGYEVKVDAKYGEADSDLINSFKTQSHKLNLLPHQVQGLSDWMNELAHSEKITAGKDNEAELLQARKGLEEKWGGAFESNVAKAALVMKENAPPELAERFRKKNLHNDVDVVELLSIIGGMYSEDQLKNAAIAPGVLAPAQAQKEIDKVLGDMAGPYYHKSHPGHKAAVAEMQDLYDQVYS